MKHDTFKNTSYEYKKGQFGSFARGLLHAYYSGDKKQRQAALKMMKEFNRSGLGGALRWDFRNSAVAVYMNGEYIGETSYDSNSKGDGYNWY